MEGRVETFSTNRQVENLPHEQAGCPVLWRKGYPTLFFDNFVKRRYRPVRAAGLVRAGRQVASRNSHEFRYKERRVVQSMSSTLVNYRGFPKGPAPATQPDSFRETDQDGKPLSGAQEVPVGANYA
jgi:hypothetical protein